MAEELEEIGMEDLKFERKDGLQLRVYSRRNSYMTAQEVAVFDVGKDDRGHWTALTRADLEKLRDWIDGRLEETKPNPQPGEVWEVEEFPGRWLKKGLGWDRVDSNSFTSEATAIRRVGRIVYDDE